MNPVLVALDFPTLGEAEAMATAVRDHVGGFKVGLQLLMSEGSAAISAITGLGLPVFADAKLHDIPNTVAGAARQIAAHGARWVSVHAGGGTAMLEAAVKGLSLGARDEPAGALVVTVLTSLDDDDLETTGVNRTVGDQVAAMTALAASSGAEGVICSPFEAHTVKSIDKGLLAVTPGVRTTNSLDDQKRVASPVEAIALGADYLVVGRSITKASDPVDAAARIEDALQI